MTAVVARPPVFGARLASVDDNAARAVKGVKAVLRVPLADGTLVPTPGLPPYDLFPSLLATSDVLGTGWFAADAANVKPGSTVVVVGGLHGVYVSAYAAWVSWLVRRGRAQPARHR